MSPHACTEEITQNWQKSTPPYIRRTFHGLESADYNRDRIAGKERFPEFLSGYLSLAAVCDEITA